MAFDKNFIFGAASASYQIEGSPLADGKGLNIWDVYSHVKGRTAHGETGDVACDSYNRYEEDIAILKELGIKNYRFSISWARILPDGIGRINQKGIDYYSNLVDRLIENGITPYVTLFHWDYPYELFRKGGWLNDDSSDWFVEYVKDVVDALSDRVSHWFTINEPQCFIGLGYQIGKHAPFLKLSDRDLVIMSRNVMLAHGKAVKYIRENAKMKPMISFAPIGPVYCPEDNSPESIEKAYNKTFSPEEGIEGVNMLDVAWWSDPIILGKHSESNQKLLEKLGLDGIFKEEDFKIIAQPLDFFSANIYYNNFAQGSGIYGYEDGAYIGSPRTATNWPITPDVLYWAPIFFYRRYKLPFLISENGMACFDLISLDGKVHDPARQDYLQRYLNALEKASKEVPVIGYFYWSLLDNYEWDSGYDKRFGLVYVNYKTQERIIKDSAYWYKNYIKEHSSK